MFNNILEVQTLGLCNLNCKNCSALVDFDYNKNYYISEEEIIEILKVAKKSHYKILVITGGEAILHPNIERILELIFESGFIIWMNTNGILKDKLSNLKTKFPKLIYKNSYKTSSFQPLFKNFHFTVDDIKSIGGEVLSVRTPYNCELASRPIYHLGKYYMCCLGGMNAQLNNKLHLGYECIDSELDIEIMRERQKELCSSCGQQGIHFTNPNKVDISTLGRKWRTNAN